MAIQTRKERFDTLAPDEPAYRWKQFTAALFDPAYSCWSDVAVLPKILREKIQTTIPWLCVTESIVQQSAKQDTFKALLEVEDGNKIETVLMQNPRGAWTICVSSQVGCAMRCVFCATGKMGLIRNLTSDEIIDQYRFWMAFLKKHPELPTRISNIVFMGMGEPMANYSCVRDAIQTIITHTSIGETRITVSTVGVLPRLEKLLNDPNWPHVRLAISLHSADPETRKRIVPTSYDDFLPALSDWAKRYLKKFGNRRHHLTFEYVMLRGVNDSLQHAKALVDFVSQIGHIRVNLIPYNFTDGGLQCSTSKGLEDFFAYLDTHGLTVTKRRTMGEDIAAACGQLYATKK
ncbi:23S rRNA (adenine(2503)-C(2))-methyltransferase RlmN [Candidatus Uhrbacteria bacterium]|nr:23S rRNA (adenine(2503)-C(2))-methyltransferase RlmN [Candidatus Uhrbacteria bacterium]